MKYIKPKDQGFTLLEVLVALVIFSVTALALMKVAINSTQALQQNQLRTNAHFVAMNVAAETQIQGDWITGSASGQRTEQGEQWQINKKAEKTLSENIQKITIDVAYIDPERQAPHGVTSLIFFNHRPLVTQ